MIRTRKQRWHAVAMCVAFPPPVNGSTKNCLRIAEHLTREGIRLQRMDLSLGSVQRRKLWSRHLGKTWRYLQVACSMFTGRCFGRSPLVYHVPNGGSGLWYSLILTIAVRTLRLPITFHHRTYQYIDCHRRLMRCILSLLGNSVSHVFLSRGMLTAFERQYGTLRSATTLSNAALNDVAARSSPRERPRGTVRIGFLSALTKDKGCLDAIAGFRELTNRRSDFRIEFHVAGPALDAEVDSALQRLLVDYDDQIVNYGEITGAAKERFFELIDVFLFPTRYRKEAQPNVIFEALARGVPVATRDRGCIREMVPSGENCLVIARDAAFAAPFADWMLKMLADQEGRSYERASSACLEFLSNQRVAAESELRNFIDSFRSDCIAVESS